MVVASTHGSYSAAGSYLKPRIHCSCSAVGSVVENRTECECIVGSLDGACAVGGSCLNSSNNVNVLSETDHLYMDGVSHN